MVLQLAQLVAAVAAVSVSSGGSCTLQPERMPDPLGFQQYSISNRCSARQLDAAQDALLRRKRGLHVLGVLPAPGRYLFVVAPRGVVEAYTEQHYTPCGSFRVVSWKKDQPYLILGSLRTAVCDR